MYSIFVKECVIPLKDMIFPPSFVKRRPRKVISQATSAHLKIRDITTIIFPIYTDHHDLVKLQPIILSYFRFMK